MIAFALASIMICIGMVIRSKVTFISHMLVPTSVIAGMLGLFAMNLGLSKIVDFDLYMQIVTYLFTITFISIGLTSNNQSNKHDSSVGKQITKGAVSLGLVWNILYALTPAVGLVVILLVGGFFEMDPVYGLMIPFAFAQGPGQASTFGLIMESEYGIANAAQVGVTFATAGFLVCFLVGVPLVRYGIKRGLTKHMKDIEANDFLTRGYYDKDEERDVLGKETVYSGNLDTMTFHFAMIGVCFLLALGMAKVISFIPGIGGTFSGMLFIYGMLAGYLVKYILRKLQINHLIDNTFQSKITGWSTDYLVVASFMAVPFSIIGLWIVPITIEIIVVTIITLIISIYFCQRIGGDNDFERTLGLFGTATGTVPSGIALIRIIDPSLRTTTAIELGLMNVPMVLSYITVITIFGIAAGTLSIGLGIILLIAPIPIYLILLKVSKGWGARTYTLKETKLSSLNTAKVISK